MRAAVGAECRDSTAGSCERCCLVVEGDGDGVGVRAAEALWRARGRGSERLGGAARGSPWERTEGLCDGGAEVVIADGVVEARVSELAAEVLEDGAVEGAEGGADDGLTDRCCRTRPMRGERSAFGVADVERGGGVLAGDEQGAGGGVDAAVDVVSDGERRLVLVAEAEVEGTSWRRDAPVVLEQRCRSCSCGGPFRAAAVRSWRF